MNFKDKTILIIGGSNGIGREAAKQFSIANARVIISGRDKLKLKTTQRLVKKATGNSIQYIQADVTSMKSLLNLKKELIASNLSIDSLIITSGIGKFGMIGDTSEQDYDLIMDTNTKGTFFAVSILKELINEGGSITLTSSFLTKHSLPLTSVLTASKAAINSFTGIFAKELSIYNIRVNAISPGSTKTDFMEVANPLKLEIEILKKSTPNIPLGKRATPSEIVDSILFLSSEHANYITGTILDVDGGLSVA